MIITAYSALINWYGTLVFGVTMANQIGLDLVSDNQYSRALFQKDPSPFSFDYLLLPAMDRGQMCGLLHSKHQINIILVCLNIAVFIWDVNKYLFRFVNALEFVHSE